MNTGLRRAALSVATVVCLGVLVGCGGGAKSLTPFQTAAAGDPGYDRIALGSVLPGQYLVPVQIGNQVFRLLLDTGFQGILVFGDLVKDSNRAVKRTGRPASLLFGSGRRTGEFAVAPIALGQRTAYGVHIVVIDKPTSTTDRSLAAKGAQGILGLRFKPGAGGTANRVDPVLLKLAPAVRSLEFDLRPSGASSLVIGGTPALNSAGSGYVFTAKTTTALSADRVAETYADLEVPFRVTTSAGVADTPGLRVLLDTGAVNELVLDRTVAARLGYDTAASRWTIPATEVLNLELLGTPSPLAMQTQIHASDVLVADLRAYAFDAVLGVGQWQPYLIAFDFLDWTLGGPDGTFRFLARSRAGAATAHAGWSTDHYTALPAMNSSAEDVAPGVSGDGSVVVFCSDRAGGVGLRDVYYYRLGQGLVDIGSINSAARDEAPTVSADGNLVAFTSDRAGGWDIYLYNVATRQFVDLPGLNTAALERAPQLSPSGRYLAFRSERDEGGVTLSRLYVYDRDTQQLLDTPGLNGTTDQYTARVSADGQRLAYDANGRAGDRGGMDVHLYDLTAKRDVPLSSSVNSVRDDQFVTLSADGRYLAFQTDRWGQSAGATGTDVAVFDLNQNGTDGKPGVLVSTPGLNLTGFEDSSPALSGNGRCVIFTSSRPRGLGGPDLYRYDLGTAATRAFDGGGATEPSRW
ncbi:MAG: PD40 domain-containing protein [Armatimonadetes bacterium]|nr:PD40 domain-containing protein [Armatimonadota bacterium]